MTEAQQPIATLDSLAALSHEFRTPLNGVLGMAQLLENTRLTAEQRAYVDVLKQSGDHLLSLVNDLLDLAKMNAGTLTLELAAFDAPRLLQSVTELMSPRAHDKGLEIAWAAPIDLPIVLADEGRLRQVLLNLVGNAIKFTDEGGALLGVSVVAAESERVRMRFTVEDTGPGVPAAQQERIFQAFAQGDASHAARPDSTGLGLAVVKRLADGHNGAVGIDSETGKGACFWFEAEFALHETKPSARPLAGHTVVVASGHPILRKAACRQIEAVGGKAIECGDPAEAAALAPPGSVVLIDHAQAKPKSLLRPLADNPCLILVTPEQRGAIARYRAAGFAGYLIKPLRAASVAERVLAVLGYSAAAHVKDERAAVETAPGMRVLLVEDNPVNALLARKLLEREGCAVDWVTSGEMALTAAKVGHDLILMDRRMLGLDGLQTTARLREAGIETPIVALTADAFEEDRRLCLAAGMDDFLGKPLDPTALRNVLARTHAHGWTKPAKDAKLAS